MRLFQRFEYRLAKEERDALLLFQHARDAMRGLRGEEHPVRFYLEDPGHSHVGRSVSALERVLKRFPDLERYVHRYSDDDGNLLPGPHKHMGNLPPPWREANPNGVTRPVDADTAAAILDGVPRRYPFASAAVVFDEVDWFGAEEGGPPAAPPPCADPRQLESSATMPLPPRRSCVLIESCWGISRREVAMYATVERAPADPETPSLPPLPAAADEALDRLGKRHVSGMDAVATVAEEECLRAARAEAEPIWHATAENVNGPLEGVNLPHDLPPDPEFIVDPPSVSTKRPLTAALRPLGYERNTKRSGQGGSVYVRRQPNHNQVHLLFDIGTWSQSMSAAFAYHGALWWHSMGFSITRGQPNPQYDINDQETMDKVAENAATVVRYLEGQLIPPLDELYGPAPAWWEHDG